MKKREKAVVKDKEISPSVSMEPKCLPVFESGVRSANDMIRGISLLMADVITQRVGTAIGNTICRSAGTLMKAAELQQRYGTTGDHGQKVLVLG